MTSRKQLEVKQSDKSQNFLTSQTCQEIQQPKYHTLAKLDRENDYLKWLEHYRLFLVELYSCFTDLTNNQFNHRLSFDQFTQIAYQETRPVIDSNTGREIRPLV